MAKLQRKSAKLFAENANAGIGGIAQFGSLAAGDINYSKDVDVIQALDAYKNGWSDAVVGNKSPAIEDRNALDYLLSYHQAYIMQRGIPEWLNTETYYVGCVVTQNSSIYISLKDNNTSALTDGNAWRKFYTPAEIDDFISQIYIALGNKANNDFSNVTKPYITQTYSNGSSWYRIWSDGWCEQGAYQSSISGDGPTPVTFLVTMADTNYSVFGGVVPSASSANDSRFEAYTRTTTGMNIDWTNASHVDGTWWEVKGYKAN